MESLSQKEALNLIGKRATIKYYAIPGELGSIQEEKGTIISGSPMLVETTGEEFWQKEYRMIALTFRNDKGYDTFIQLKDIEKIEVK